MLFQVTVKDMRQKLGDFMYEDVAFERQLGQCQQREPVLLENGARYEGEWIPGTQIR